MDPLTPEELRSIREFAAEIEAYERDHFDPARQAAEDLTLNARFPGQLVAYVDAWDGKTLTRRVLAHAPGWRLLREALAAYPEAEIESATVRYIDPPNIALCTRALTGEIRSTAPPRVP